MSDTSEPVTPLSIARHAVQFMLHSALNADPRPCFGLIGRKKGATINHAAPLPCTGAVQCAEQAFTDSNLQQTLEEWAAREITPCGLFFTIQDDRIPDCAKLERLAAVIKQAAPELAEKSFVYMPLALNTAGCLEAFAYQIRNDSLIPVPLILEEDGQETKNG